jgi:phosphopantothenoylcysteine decarboxylase/phosphopantothenate--cysteine ligase
VVGREDRPYVVGFAAETDGIERAIEKAVSKDVDLLVYNDVTEPGSGFGTDTNRVAFIDRDRSVKELPLLAKEEVAARLWDRIGSDLGREV